MSVWLYVCCFVWRCVCLSIFLPSCMFTIAYKYRNSFIVIIIMYFLSGLPIIVSQSTCLSVHLFLCPRPGTLLSPNYAYPVTRGAERDRHVGHQWSVELMLEGRWPAFDGSPQPCSWTGGWTDPPWPGQTLTPLAGETTAARHERNWDNLLFCIF